MYIYALSRIEDSNGLCASVQLTVLFLLRRRIKEKLCSNKQLTLLYIYKIHINK